MEHALQGTVPAPFNGFSASCAMVHSIGTCFAYIDAMMLRPGCSADVTQTLHGVTGIVGRKGYSRSKV